MMKKLTFIILTLICFQNGHCQSNSKPKKASLKTQTTKDSVPLFYGLTAKKILSLSVPEGKALIKEKGISIDDYFKARARANIYLNEIQIKKDSIETMKIYDRIEKKLNMKKKNE